MSSLSSSISNDLTTGLTDATTGAKSFGAAFSDIHRRSFETSNDDHQALYCWSLDEVSAIRGVRIWWIAWIRRIGIGGAPATSTGAAGVGALGGLYDIGGYRSGRRARSWCIVHRGEVVWSQADVSRAGGVGVVEAIRQGQRGYAEGGPVMPSNVIPMCGMANDGPSKLPNIIINNQAGTKVQQSGVKQNASGDFEVTLINVVTGVMTADAAKNGPISKAFAARAAGYKGS